MEDTRLPLELKVNRTEVLKEFLINVTYRKDILLVLLRILRDFYTAFQRNYSPT